MLSLCKKYLILTLAIPLSWCATIETGVAQQPTFTPQVGPIMVAGFCFPLKHAHDSLKVRGENIIAIGTPDSQNPIKATLSVWANPEGEFSILLDFPNGISCGIFNGTKFQSLK